MEETYTPEVLEGIANKEWAADRKLRAAAPQLAEACRHAFKLLDGQYHPAFNMLSIRNELLEALRLAGVL